MSRKQRALKPWDDMTYDQKRHAIFNFLVARTTAFWRVCGKDVQTYYKYLPLTEETVTNVRDEIVSVYREKLKTAKVYDKDEKIKFMERHLLK